jgi:8-oxo-dGTP pyrophosphatase MutT (NUDIX family)
MNQLASPPARFPVSVKGVAVQNGLVLLLHNERDEWELAGGKLAIGEDPTECVAREFLEETGWEVEVADPIHNWLYHIRDDIHVYVSVYGTLVRSEQAPQVSHEHKEVGLFAPSEVLGLRMPEPYKVAIAKWCKALGLG